MYSPTKINLCNFKHTVLIAYLIMFQIQRSSTKIIHAVQRPADWLVTEGSLLDRVCYSTRRHKTLGPTGCQHAFISADATWHCSSCDISCFHKSHCGVRAFQICEIFMFEFFKQLCIFHKEVKNPLNVRNWF